uniref:Uncharacterized protein n=1 Tax=Timema poppense TaxID=170557 RepID=A0A7R9CHB1_TIMPO|nr:unnamed protein product [Timema poppensis]
MGSKTRSEVVDSRGEIIRYYPEVPEVLKKLANDGIILAVASRTSEIKGANQLLKLFDWDQYFKYKEIYPGSKVTHFNKIKKDSGVSFKDMIFFDDEQRNIRDLTQHGVVSILVKNGVSFKVIEEGLLQFRKGLKSLWIVSIVDGSFSTSSDKHRLNLSSSKCLNGQPLSDKGPTVELNTTSALANYATEAGVWSENVLRPQTRYTPDTWPYRSFAALLEPG